MTVTLTGDVTMLLDFVYREDTELGELGYQEHNDQFRFAQSFSSGIADQQVNRKWEQRRTVTLATVSDQLDLAGGLTDRFGNTLTFAEIKALMVVNRGVVAGDADDETATVTSGEDILVGGVGSNAWASLFNGDVDAKVLVRSGGALLLCAPYDGYSVSPGTADILEIEHNGSAASGGDISYDIAIWGVQS